MQRWPDLPMAVLVNRNTASAAELITTALQDHDRAAIIGMPTYGKGVVQTTFRLGDDVALKLTTARWFGPSGRSIQRPLPAGQAEWAPALADSLELRTRRFTSSAGRPLQAAAGVVPDQSVRQAALTEDERTFVGGIGSDLGLYHDVLAGYARELKAAERPASENFAVTGVMRAAVLERLERSGLHVAPPVYEAAAEYVDQEIGYALTRKVFGAAAETRRRARDDRQLMAAAALLARSHSTGDPVALAARR
jgi:carboxyl-terminal processing protease